MDDFSAADTQNIVRDIFSCLEHLTPVTSRCGPNADGSSHKDLRNHEALSNGSSDSSPLTSRDLHQNRNISPLLNGDIATKVSSENETENSIKTPEAASDGYFTPRESFGEKSGGNNAKNGYTNFRNGDTGLDEEDMVPAIPKENGCAHVNLVNTDVSALVSAAVFQEFNNGFSVSSSPHVEMVSVLDLQARVALERESSAGTFSVTRALENGHSPCVTPDINGDSPSPNSNTAPVCKNGFHFTSRSDDSSDNDLFDAPVKYDEREKRSLTLDDEEPVRAQEQSEISQQPIMGPSDPVPQVTPVVFLEPDAQFANEKSRFCLGETIPLKKPEQTLEAPPAQAEEPKVKSDSLHTKGISDIDLTVSPIRNSHSEQEELILDVIPTTSRAFSETDRLMSSKTVSSEISALIPAILASEGNRLTASSSRRFFETNRLIGSKTEILPKKTGLFSEVRNIVPNGLKVVPGNRATPQPLTAVNWEAKVRGKSNCKISTETSSSRRKKTKVIQKEECDTATQLSGARFTCLCEETIKLGVKGNVDRFSLDYNKAWKEWKNLSKSSWAPEGADAASRRFVCQARMSLGEKLFRCVRPVWTSKRGELFRCSTTHPLRALCELHMASFKNHNCCPTCGVFCETGEYRSCKRNSSHLYHEGCHVDKAGNKRCPHCLNHSEHVTITVKNPGFAQFDFGDLSLPPDLSMIARLPPVASTVVMLNTHFRDFSLGFRVTCAYLPSKYATQLERALKEVDNSHEIEMDWTHLLHFIAEDNVKGVLQFIQFPGNFQKLFGLITPESFAPLTVPVHAALKFRRLTILSILLHVGFPLHAPDENGILPFEQAALVNDLNSLNLLKKFYQSDFPSSSIRELSLRKFMEKKLLSSIACLFRAGFYDFEEFNITENQKRLWITEFLGCGNCHAVSNFLECRQIVDAMRFSSFSSEIIIELMSNWKNNFAVTALQRIGIRLKDRIPTVITDLSSWKMVKASTGGSYPVAGATGIFDGEDDLIILEDISSGREFHPVQVANKFDESLPRPFCYITSNTLADQRWPSGYTSKPNCRCHDNCQKICSCMKRGSYHPAPNYTKDKRLNLKAPLQGQILHECNGRCICAKECCNRVVQQPSFGFFQVYCMEPGVWGLRSKFALPEGFFVGKIVGVLCKKERLRKYIEPDSDEIYLVSNGAETFALNVRDSGNYTRFIRKAPQGNLLAVMVMTDDYAGAVPQIAFFTKQAVAAYEPLILEAEKIPVISLFPLLPPPKF